MPATQQALRLTDAYRATLGRLAALVDAKVRQEWRQVAVEDLEPSYDRWLSATAVLVSAAQTQGVRLSGAYLAAFVSAELAVPPVPQGLVADRYAGQSRDGRPLTEALLPPLFTIKQSLGTDQGFDEALAAGLNRATRTVAREVLETPRNALDDAIRQDGRVVGWRRVTASKACGACLAAATGAVQSEKETLPVHDHCSCTKEPVVKGARERFRRPTGQETFQAMSPEEQDRIYGEKAELIRSGQVPFKALLDHSPMAVLSDQITETPLAALRATP